jgi:hypothetical protein
LGVDGQSADYPLIIVIAIWMALFIKSTLPHFRAARNKNERYCARFFG